MRYTKTELRYVGDIIASKIQSRVAGLFLCIAYLSVAFIASARQLAPDEVMIRVREHQRSNTSRITSAGVNHHLSLSHQIPLSPDSSVGAYGDSSNQAALYIFNAANGFVVAPADDRLRPVLAVSDNGRFNPDSIPDNLRWWLEEYRKEISDYLSSPQAAIDGMRPAKAPSRSLAYNAGWQPIEPMVKTKWNQDSPYNLYCPDYNGTRTVTGCVATAFAQVVNFHRYADTSKYAGQTISYTTASHGIQIYYTMPGAFNFDNMLDTYVSGEYTDGQAMDVAELMKVCGVIMEMDYKPASEGGSGAVTYYVPERAKEYFGYADSSTEFTRSFYQTKEWEELLYKELSKGRPVVYSGQADAGGHAFVCDGYAGDGLFHFNWGWGGLSDGDFAVTALNPDSQGIGSFEGGYNSSQGFYTLVPPTAADATESPMAVCLYDADPVVSESKVTFYSFMRGQSAAVVSAILGYQVFDSEGNRVLDNQWGLLQYEKNHVYGPSLALPTDLQLPDGTYQIYLSYRFSSAEEWKKMVENGYTNHLTLVVAGGNYTYIVGDPSDSSLLVVMETSFSDQYYLETGINAQFALLNDGTADFDDSLYAWFINASDSSKQIGLKWKDGILIPAGESALLDLSVDLAGSGFTSGSWYFGILDGDYNQLTDWKLFTVAEGCDPLYSAKSSAASMSFAIPEYVYEDYVLDLPSGVLFTSHSDSDLSIGFAIYKKGEADPCAATILGSLPAATMSAIKEQTMLLGGFPTVSFNTSMSVQIGSMDLDLCEYEFAFVDNTLALLSPRYPFSYAAKCDGILYASAGDGNVMAVGLLEESDQLEISASVEIKGKTYCVVGLGDNLFLRNKNVEVVKLPPSISTIGRNTFSYAGMSSVYFWSGEVPTQYPQYSFGGINPDVNFHVPYRAYDSYVRALENYGNVLPLYDLNTDYDENIADVTYLGDEVMGDTGVNYDLNGDEQTNVGDMTWLVNHLLGGGSSEPGAFNIAPRDNYTQLLELGFDNYDDCIAIQADVEVNGISDKIRICLADALSKTHALAWSFLDDSHIRILIYSINNSPFSIADGIAVFSIESDAGLELRDMNAVAVGRSHQCRQLNAAVCSVSTPQSAPVVVKIEYFDLQGMPVVNPEGLHIVKKTYSNGYIYTQKQIK